MSSPFDDITPEERAAIQVRENANRRYTTAHAFASSGTSGTSEGIMQNATMLADDFLKEPK